jgi:hypothetical protein
MIPNKSRGGAPIKEYGGVLSLLFETVPSANIKRERRLKFTKKDRLVADL